jgi:ATP/maltotriose-dependent transcriptional regulator MalT
MEEEDMDGQIDVQTIVAQAIDEYMRKDSARREPAYKTELQEERRRREQLEKRMNELVEENKRSRAMAEETQRNATIRTELQKLGVMKIDLAYKALQDGIVRTEDGRLVARGENGDQPVAEYLASFVQENPEFLPARIAGGTGMTGTQKAAPDTNSGAVDLDKIGPSMSKEDLDRVRREILRVTSQTLRGA